MATKPREESETGFYHVFHRGVNHCDIFEDDEDRSRYLELLKKYSRILNVDIHSWCLMSNHTHMVLHANKLEDLSIFMRRVGSVFARFFNSRHGRLGPLFGGRFSSVCIRSDAQVMTTVRYVHRNPLHHDDRTLYGSYPWSSYREYVDGTASISRTDFVLGLFGNVDDFKRFHEIAFESERHLDIDTIGRLGDDEARSRANSVLAAAGFDVAVTNVGALPRELRDGAISLVKNHVGCSMRQIQRLTALAYSAIKRAVEMAQYTQARSQCPDDVNPMIWQRSDSIERAC